MPSWITRPRLAAALCTTSVVMTACSTDSRLLDSDASLGRGDRGGNQGSPGNRLV